MKTKILILIMSLVAVTAMGQTALDKASENLEKSAEAAVVTPKPKYWTLSTQANVNFIESYYSNWAKGGITNFLITGYFDAKANYKKEDLFLNNRLQLDYGIMYAVDKKYIQKVKDRILFESTFGHKAYKGFSYSARFTFLSQFANGYNYEKNPNKITSNIFAPAVMTLGIGTDWEVAKWLSFNFSPVALGMTIVKDKDLRLAYSIEQDKFYRFELGSQLTTDLKFQINDNFKFNSHLILFYDYLQKPPHSVRVLWDNRVIWQLSKIFAVNMTTNMIWDKTVLIEGRPRLQFSQALQFGISYAFQTKR